jgi:hypothetical protein
MTSRCNSPASTISIDESAGHDNSLLTIQTTSNCQLNESVQYEALLTALSDDHVHWLHVQKLDKCTTDVTLREIFYHFGANEAFVITDSDCQNRRPHGFVSFAHPAMAELAVEKVHTFVPFRQTGPLVVERLTADKIRESLKLRLPVEIAEDERGLYTANGIRSQLWDVLHPSQMHNLQVFLSAHRDQSNEALAEMMISSIDASSPIQRINLATLLCKNSALSKLPRGESIRLAFLNELRKYEGALSHEIQRLTGSSNDQPVVCRGRPIVSAQTQRRIHDAVLRTVYVSKIPPELSRAALMREISRHGQVLKLRTCNGHHGSSAYAFVEMDTPAAANTIVGCGQLTVEGFSLRTQHAKAPIQDASRSDTVARTTATSRF